MGFWIFMLILNLLIPFTMIGFGGMFLKSPPKKINSVFGYRTSMSMKNQDTWEFAHKHWGNLWRNVGWIMLALSVIIMLTVIGKNQDTIGKVGALLCEIQLVLLVGSIFPTHRALKKTFDKQGNRRQ